ncbi:hypothetical protein Tco_0108461 [Tanacetum coccineum]
MTRKSISQTEQQECKVAENANNKRKWEGNHMTQDCRNPAAARNQQTHACYECGSLRHFKSNHNGQCAVKFGNYKKVDHMTQDCRNPAAARNQRTHACYECGSECPIVKFQKRVDKKISTLAERQTENKRKLARLA